MVFLVGLRRPVVPARLASLVNAFSPFALLGAGLIVASGATTAALYLHAVSDLWTSAYGRAILAKVLLVGAVAAAGFVNWQHIRPRLSDPATAVVLRRSATVELLLAAAVLIVTAVLVGLPQPGE
jgi:putative copper export protein